MSAGRPYLDAASGRGCLIGEFDRAPRGRRLHRRELDRRAGFELDHAIDEEGAAVEKKDPGYRRVREVSEDVEKQRQGPEAPAPR